MVAPSEPPLLLALLIAASAQATPARIVAIGDGLVGVPASEAATEDVAGAVDEGAHKSASADEAVAGHTPSPGGWTTVLADCLEEGAPARWAVSDQTAPAETAKTALEKVDEVAELRPEVVMVSVGAQEMANTSPDVVERDASALVGALSKGKHGPVIVLVGVVAPTLSQMEGDGAAADASQADIDGKTDAVNAVLAKLAESAERVHHVDLWQDWPREVAERAALTTAGWNLSAQGHAKVAAIVCDKVLGWAENPK